MLASRAGPSVRSWVPVAAENSVKSCDQQILVYQAAEPISSYRSNGRSGVRGSAAGWRVLME